MDSTMFFKRGGNYMIRSTRRPGLSSPSPRGNKPPKRHIVYKEKHRHGGNALHHGGAVQAVKHTVKIRCAGKAQDYR